MGQTATIAYILGDLGAWMGCLVTDVRIERPYAQKILFKHSLRYEHFSMLQPTIDHGYCIQLKPQHLEFLYHDDRVFDCWFLLVLKSCRSGSECWVVTYFKTNPQQVRSKLRRANARDALIREHHGAFD